MLLYCLWISKEERCSFIKNYAYCPAKRIRAGIKFEHTPKPSEKHGPLTGYEGASVHTNKGVLEKRVKDILMVVQYAHDNRYMWTEGVLFVYRETLIALGINGDLLKDMVRELNRRFAIPLDENEMSQCIFNSMEENRRYTFSNEYLLKVLHLLPQDERVLGLYTIMSDEERTRRRYERAGRLVSKFDACRQQILNVWNKVHYSRMSIAKALKQVGGKPSAFSQLLRRFELTGEKLKTASRKQMLRTLGIENCKSIQKMKVYIAEDNGLTTPEMEHMDLLCSLETMALIEKHGTFRNAVEKGAVFALRKFPDLSMARPIKAVWQDLVGYGKKFIDKHFSSEAAKEQARYFAACEREYFAEKSTLDSSCTKWNDESLHSYQPVNQKWKLDYSVLDIFPD